MIKCFWFVFLFSFVFSSKTLLSVGDSLFYVHDFYQQVPMSEWASFDSTKKERALNSFVEKNLVFLESVNIGLDKHPKTNIQLTERYNQLLVNEYYEKSVAAPLINKKALSKINNFILDKVYVYHLLVGFKGSSLKGEFKKSKDEALAFVSNLKVDFEKKASNLSADEKIDLFVDLASSFSDDPSVESNKGELGWVSWGKTMSSFQNAVFSSNVLSITDPVLTDYGYHLAFVSKKGFSDFYYYNKKHLDDIAIKLGLQTVSLDSLRFAATNHDSLVFLQNKFVINSSFVSLLVEGLNKKTKKEGLRGGKNLYVEWLQEHKNKDVLFVFKDEGFGLSWFIDKLKKTPGTRVPVFKKPKDFEDLLKSFVLQDYVVLLAKEKNLDKDSFFIDQFLNHKKNILYKKYEDFVFKEGGEIDSLSVKSHYNKGVFNGDYIKPKQAVFSEIRVSEKSLIDSVYSLFLSGSSFDNLLEDFKGSLQKPISFGGKGLFGEVVFSLKQGEVSKPFENLNKTFSIVRLERFLEEEPFSLDRVYSQIKQKLIKEVKDSIRLNLSKNLFNKSNAQLNREVLSF